MEEIRSGLELNDYGMQQRRIAHMRFLGELYNYEHVDSSVIFETLYLITIFGHGTPEVWNPFQNYNYIHISGMFQVSKVRWLAPLAIHW